MNRRALVATVTGSCLVMLLAIGGLLGATRAYAASTQQTFLTFYGWYDNTPPGGDIAYPQIHDTAGGKGTFADPITFATSTAELSPGTKVWVPRVKKYFIMEDSCQECSADWNGHGPNGGPKLRHYDLWLGGKGGNAFDAINCEDALTHYNADNTPTLEPVVVNPGANEPYDSTPIFNTRTGECYGGAQPNITTGQYKNGSSGQCLDDPGNSSTTGTALKTAACTGAASQRFTFQGAFLQINNLCAANSGGKITLVKCTGGPAQQWSINPNGTISDIQTGQKCIRASGSDVVAGSCSGAASQWAFTSSATNDFTVSLQPASGSVTAGGSTTATVSTAVVSGAPGSVALSATGAPAGVTVSFTPASVTAGATSTMTVSTTAGAASGPATITVTAKAAAATHAAAYVLTIAGSGGGGPALLSQGKAAKASSTESASHPASAAFDGNLTGSRWASKEKADPQWLQVDLGATASVSQVKLTWEAAYGKAYTIQTSPDGATWTTVYSTTTGNGGTDDLTGLTGTGRYVRVNGTARGTAYGYSLYEMQVYGTV